LFLPALDPHQAMRKTKPNANIHFGVSIIQKINLTLNDENCILGNLKKIPPQLNVFEVFCFNLKSDSIFNYNCPVILHNKIIK
jgi:hypothetical protein